LCLPGRRRECRSRSKIAHHYPQNIRLESARQWSRFHRRR
jgi:hypothetical protein